MIYLPVVTLSCCGVVVLTIIIPVQYIYSEEQWRNWVFIITGQGTRPEEVIRNVKANTLLNICRCCIKPFPPDTYVTLRVVLLSILNVQVKIDKYTSVLSIIGVSDTFVTSRYIYAHFTGAQGIIWYNDEW